MSRLPGSAKGLEMSAEVFSTQNSTPPEVARARSEEVANLNRTFKASSTHRRFSKLVPSSYRGIFKSSETETSPLDAFSSTPRLPFHHLKIELSLLLGSCGAKMVVKAWERASHQVDEKSAEALRPTLLRLFATAARVAAPRGLGRPLKTLIGNFERDYFPVNEEKRSAEPIEHQQRFQLLATIQVGEGAKLLTTVLTEKTHDLKVVRRLPSRPSEGISEEQVRCHREFLFENAYRARNWAEAYRQGRLLSLAESSVANSTFRSRYREIIQRLLADPNESLSKKKQLNVDLQNLSFDLHGNPSTRATIANAVLSPIHETCRPGEREELLVRALPISDARWSLSFRQHFRQRPSSEVWIAQLGKLWQAESETRPLCRLIFSLVRFSRRRTEETLRSHAWLTRRPPMEPLLQRSRLLRAAEEVERWNSLLTDDLHTPKTVTPGARVQLSPDLWQHLVRCASSLGHVTPREVRLAPLSEHARLEELPQGLTLLVNPTLLSLSRDEIKFILARTLFRFFSGLESLEARWRGLHQPATLLKVAQKFVRNREHHTLSDGKRLLERCAQTVTREELMVNLEDLFWSTKESAYKDFAHIAHQGCWYLKGETEAIRFGQHFCDLVTASYGLVGSALACQPLYRSSEAMGLGSLHTAFKDDPWLVLALQNLWMNEIDDQQKQLLTK